MDKNINDSEKIEQEKDGISEIELTKSQTELTKAETELTRAETERAKIQTQTHQGWQGLVKDLADKFERVLTQKTKSEIRYTTTLTIGILVLLSVIVGALFTLTLMDKVGGESLLFFLGTLTGSVIMLVAARIESRE